MDLKPGYPPIPNLKNNLQWPVGFGVESALWGGGGGAALLQDGEEGGHQQLLHPGGVSGLIQSPNS